jgi:hypothetical protein
MKKKRAAVALCLGECGRLVRERYSSDGFCRKCRKARKIRFERARFKERRAKRNEVRNDRKSKAPALR